MENEPCYKELVLGTYAAKLNIPNLIKKNYYLETYIGKPRMAGF